MAAIPLHSRCGLGASGPSKPYVLHSPDFSVVILLTHWLALSRSLSELVQLICTRKGTFVVFICCSRGVALYTLLVSYLLHAFHPFLASSLVQYSTQTICTSHAHILAIPPLLVVRRFGSISDHWALLWLTTFVVRLKPRRLELSNASTSGLAR